MQRGFEGPDPHEAPGRRGSDASPSRTDVGRIQDELRSQFGSDVIRRLHAENLFLDLLVSALPVAGIVVGIWAVGLPDQSWIVKLAISLTVAWLMTINGLVAHDLCVHRVRWGQRFSWLQSAVAFALLTSSATGYGRSHIRHHAHVGTAEDTEAYKQDLNTIWRRVVFCTVVGIKLVRSGRWASPRRKGYYDTGVSSPREVRQIRIEKALVLSILVAVAIGAWFEPMRALMGYVVPIVVFAPILNSLRIIIEHAEADQSNHYAFGTNYRTGLFSQLLFLADSGDCHLVHHVFPRIPCYRMPAAVRAFRPFFASKGVAERRSFTALLKGWFISGHAHRSRWPIA